MSELKLAQYPEVAELLSVLEQSGLHKEQDEVKSLVSYIDEMGTRLSAMNEELTQMHREISTIRDSTLKARCEKLISGAEKHLQQMKTTVTTVKDNFVRAATNAVSTFKDKGKEALRRALTAMRISALLETLKGGFDRSAENARKSAERLDEIGVELHKAGAHIRGAGRAMLGKPAKEAAELEHDKGVLARARSVMLRIGSSLSALAEKTERLAEKLTPGRGASETRSSVKGELRVLKSEQQPKEPVSMPLEQAR